MRRLRLTPEAELDLDEAHAWYLEQRPSLGGQFLRAVDTCVAAIRRHPEAYQLVDRKMRRALLRRFPYAVFFEVEGAENERSVGVDRAPPNSRAGYHPGDLRLEGEQTPEGAL